MAIDEAQKLLLDTRRGARNELFERFRRHIEVRHSLTRSLVSYQANRSRAFYRWFKYKEGFSAALVTNLLNEVASEGGTLLDPFAGTGSALFAAAECDWSAIGIELLPVGAFATNARRAATRVSGAAFRAEAKRFRQANWRGSFDPALIFSHLTITRDAFSPETEQDIASYRTYIRQHVADPNIAILFELAGLSVLESVSFTRKDGQYLRWDERSSRQLSGKPFSKGPIARFEDAIFQQLTMMREDLERGDLFSTRDPDSSSITLHEGSCLDILPTLPAAHFDLIVTSPPYCNRYDYTRTYALELAYLGVNGERLKSLRQALLSCTVENRAKLDELRLIYETTGDSALFASAIQAFEGQEALHEVLGLLDQKGRAGELNNPNIVRMVRNYFLESAVVIHELARILKPGGRVAMVNDNVQYGGEEVPVDLILSDFAFSAGLETEHIWVLPRGKGNSSQQMGVHGRNELRKCVYVWRRMD